MPSRVVWWIVRKTGEVQPGFVVFQGLSEWGPVASVSDIIPGETGEGVNDGEDAECAEEVKGGLPVSPWNNRLDGV